MTNNLRCVVDASVCIKQYIQDPLSSQVELLFASLINSENKIFVPDLFYIETTNALWKYIRARQLTLTKVQSDLVSLKALPLRVTSTADLITEAINIAAIYGITAYDAAYVSLSHHFKAPLLTLDQKLYNTLISTPYDVQWFADFSWPQ